MSDRNVEYQISLRDKISGKLRRIDGQTKKTTQSFNMMNNVIGVVSVAAMVRFGSTSVKTTARLESLTKAIEFSSGTALQSKLNMEFLNTTVDKLKLNYEATSQGFKTFSGAMRTSGFSAKKQRDIFLKVAKASKVMQLSGDATKGVFLALSQIMSKGKVQAEELRGQIGERLPGAFSIAAKAMGKTEAELNKMMETGQLLAKDFLPKFADQLDKDFAGGVEDAVESINSELNDLENAWLGTLDRMGKGIGKSGIVGGLTSIVKTFNNDIDKMKFFEQKFLKESFMLGGKDIKGDEKGLFTQARFEQIDNIKKKISEIQDRFDATTGNERIFFQLKETQKYSDILAKQTKEYENQRDLVNELKLQNSDAVKSEDAKLRKMRTGIALTKGIAAGIYGSLDTKSAEIDATALKASDKELFGTTLTARSPKQFNINIESLVENLDINSQTINEGAIETKNLVVNELIKGIAQIEQVAQ